MDGAQGGPEMVCVPAVGDLEGSWGLLGRWLSPAGLYPAMQVTECPLTGSKSPLAYENKPII